MGLFRNLAGATRNVTKSLASAGVPRSTPMPPMKGPVQGAPMAPLLGPRFKDRNEYRDFIASGGTREPAALLPSKVSKLADPLAAPRMKGAPQVAPLAPTAPGAPVVGRVGGKMLPPPGVVGPLAPPTPPALEGYAQAAPGDPLGAASANKLDTIASALAGRKVGKVIAPLPPPPVQKFRDRDDWREYAFSGGTRGGAPVSAPAAPLAPRMESFGAPTAITKAAASLTPPALKGYTTASPGAMVGKIEQMLGPQAQRFKNRDHYRDFISSGGSRG